ncbi:MAG: hypothetical protein EB133_12525 [Betaproteobacteria bacterium]|nr:hypothetical protein [Betaproteobacteria bacterium]
MVAEVEQELQVVQEELLLMEQQQVDQEKILVHIFHQEYLIQEFIQVAVEVELGIQDLHLTQEQVEQVEVDLEPKVIL